LVRTKPWPFVGRSLFTRDPGHDVDDREIFDHVLKMLRADFQIPDDETDPRIQILLDDAVNTYVKLAVFRSKEEDRKKCSPEVIDATERRLRNEVRVALTAIMNFLMPKKIQKTVSIEALLNKAGL